MIFFIFSKGIFRTVGLATRLSEGLSVHSWDSVVIQQPSSLLKWFWNTKTRLTSAVLPRTWMDSVIAWLRSVLMSREWVAWATPCRRWSFFFSFSWAIF